MNKLMTQTRELARRQSGTAKILLLWHPRIEQVELAVCDSVTGESFHMDIAPGDALDAFHHPYAYAAGHDLGTRVTRDEGMDDDG